MTPEYQVQKAGLAGQHWIPVYRGAEARAREVFFRQLQVYTVGRFRLVAPGGTVVEERKVCLLFGDNGQATVAAP